MIKQPKALRLAAHAEANASFGDMALIAAELRRLHEVNADLLRSLKLFLAHSSEPECAIWRHVHGVAHAAIAKAEGDAA